MAKLVDAPDLGSGAFGRVGSSPITRTKQFNKNNNLTDIALYSVPTPCQESTRKIAKKGIIEQR